MQGYDECWACGDQLYSGYYVVETRVTLAVLTGTDEYELNDAGTNPYNRSCLRCALGNLDGINTDNLDECLPGWRDNRSYTR